MAVASLAGLDLLATAVVLVDQGLTVHYANPAAENLFEIGASSLKLIEIHENIDREYPGLVDLTELFDFPTIAELAQHLEGKLAARA